MPHTNLIPADRRAAKQRRARMRLWIASCSLYALVLGGAYAVCYAAWNNDGNRLVDDLQETARHIQESVRSMGTLQRELAEAQATLQANRAVGDQPDWSVLMAVLADNVGEDIVLNNCRLLPTTKSQLGISTPLDAVSGLSAETTPLARSQFRLQLGGFGRTQTAVSQFVLRLERIELFDKVTLKKSNREKFLGGDAVAFRLECLIGSKYAATE